VHKRDIYPIPRFTGLCCVVPTRPREVSLLCRSCSSPRNAVAGFLQPPPHGDALALPLSFASTSLDRGLSPPSIETCPAHTHLITVCRPTVTFRVHPEPQAGGNTVQWGGVRPAWA